MSPEAIRLHPPIDSITSCPDVLAIGHKLDFELSMPIQRLKHSPLQISFKKSWECK